MDHRLAPGPSLSFSRGERQRKQDRERRKPDVAGPAALAWLSMASVIHRGVGARPPEHGLPYVPSPVA